jgi:hypothetical protein
VYCTILVFSVWRVDASFHTSPVCDCFQDIILSISPENTRSCRLALGSEDYLVPPLVLPHIPTTAVCGPSDVLTLTLTLKTLGVVLHPPNISSFQPASDADQASFEAFVKICQATDIQLHFARAQFGLVGAQKSERMQLRQFVGDFNTSQTEPTGFGQTSAKSGRGLLHPLDHVCSVLLSRSVIHESNPYDNQRFRTSKHV